MSWLVFTASNGPGKVLAWCQLREDDTPGFDSIEYTSMDGGPVAPEILEQGRPQLSEFLFSSPSSSELRIQVARNRFSRPQSVTAPPVEDGEASDE